MNSREKFLSVMRMESENYEGVEIPKVEFGYWAETIRHWSKEGLPITDPIPDNYLDGMAIMGNENIYSKEEIVFYLFNFLIFNHNFKMDTI